MPPKGMLYEILVPACPDWKDLQVTDVLAHHRRWDDKVQSISGGLTILSPAKGRWTSRLNVSFHERMIPVRVMCTEKQIEQIADITAVHYAQEAVMFYRVSDDVRIYHYDGEKRISS